MKGANPVLERKTSKAKTRKTAIKGMSHHFLFSFMKPQRSPKKPLFPASAAAFSKSDFWVSRFTPVNFILPNPRAEVTAVICGRSSRFHRLNGLDGALGHHQVRPAITCSWRYERRANEIQRKVRTGNCGIHLACQAASIGVNARPQQVRQRCEWLCKIHRE